MENVLKDKMIMGVTMAFREGELIKYCLDDLLKYCDKVLVLLDNQNKETEEIVLNYQKKYNNFFVVYSNVPPMEKVSLKSRLNSRQGEIRDRVLQEVRKIHKKIPIDLLVWPDGDEIFTNFLWKEFLPKFWNSDKKVLFTGSVTPMDSFRVIRNKGIVSHARIFKYCPEMTAMPYRGRCFYHPFKREEAIKYPRLLIHLALFTKKNRDFRKNIYFGRSSRQDTTKLWQTPKDIRYMKPKEIENVFKKQEPFCTSLEYFANPQKYEKYFK